MASEEVELVSDSKQPLLPTSNHVHHARRCHRRAVLWRFGLIVSGLATWYYLSGAQGEFTTKIFQSSSAQADADICLTPACIHASSEILYNLDPQYMELDPCTNFEQLVCGGWRDRHDLRPDQGDAFTGTQMSENSQTLLRHILESPYPKDSAHSFFSPAQLSKPSKSLDEQNYDKMKNAYDACLDEKAIQKLGAAPLLKVIDDIKSIFKKSSKSSKSAAKVQAVTEAVLYLSKIGITGLVSAGTGADDTNPDEVVISYGSPYKIGLPAKERYEDDKILAKYTGVVKSVLGQLLKGKADYADIVKFEKQLARASPTQQEREDVTKFYNPMSLSDAAELTPELNITHILTHLAPSSFDIKRIIVTSPPYLKKLNKIVSATDPETLLNYFIWKAVQSLASFVDAPEIKPYKRFSNEIQGKDPDSAPDRWRTCVGHVDDDLGWILSRFFIEKAFSAKAKEFGDTIVSDIKDQFVETLKQTPWMDKDVIDLAINKVHNIIQKIGYPTESPDIMDPSKLQEYYAAAKISSKTYLGNELSVRKVEVNRMWNSLGKPVDRAEWGMSAPTVNAYYNPPGNEIVFPAGIMQFPVFDVDVPPFVSYGAFGAVAGHELSHAFDSSGRHYDENGKYTDWWTNQTVKEFEDRAQCFVKQYGNFSIDGPDGKPLHVNGRLTLGENIADSSGIAASFSAWQRRRAETPNQHLPGLDHFTQEQLFFVSYANWWCGKSTKETAINRIYTDPHAPKWARILGTFANSKDFRESFNCPVKQPTCLLWGA